MSEQFHFENSAWLLRAGEAKRLHHSFFLGPAHDEGIERAAVCGEANILRGEVALLVSVEVSSCDFDFGGGAFAVNLPGTRGIDSLAVHRHPIRNALQRLQLLEVQLTGVRQREIQQQVTVLADDIVDYKR